MNRGQTALLLRGEGKSNAEIAEVLGLPKDSVRRLISETRKALGTDTPHEIRTRRCRSKQCINRFVPVNANHFYCAPECKKDSDTWTTEEILQEEGSLYPEANGLEMAKRAYGQKNQAIRKVTTLTSMRDFMRYEMSELVKENPHLRYPPRPVTPPEKGKKERQVILVVSDWQMGKLEQGIGIKVMQENRIPRILAAMRSIVDDRRAAGYAVNEAHIVFAGDLIEGCWIYGSQQVTGLDRTANTQRITRQLYVTANAIADVVTDVASYVPHVTVHSVPGNHGRPNGPNEFADPEDNFDTLACWWGKDKCASQGNVTWEIEEQWWHRFDVLGRTFIAQHGDAWNGPLVPNIEKLLPAWTLGGVFGCIPDVFLTAHRHSFAMLEVNGVTVIQNGTIDGGSGWFTRQTGKMSKPSQTIIVASAKRPAEAVYPVAFA